MPVVMYVDGVFCFASLDLILCIFYCTYFGLNCRRDLVGILFIL